MDRLKSKEENKGPGTKGLGNRDYGTSDPPSSPGTGTIAGKASGRGRKAIKGVPSGQEMPQGFSETGFVYELWYAETVQNRSESFSTVQNGSQLFRTVQGRSHGCNTDSR